MPSKMALINYNKCHPEKQHSGICAAALACSHGLLKQEAPFEIPMTDPFLCQGCADCVRACPMGVLSREFLKKLDLAENELAIVDMEAGVEHFGRGVETSIDSVLIVVEPPLESVNVGQKIHELASGIGIKNVWAVLNNIPSEEIAARLKTELEERHIEVIGCIYSDDDIFSASMEGKIPANGAAVLETKEVMDNILSRAGVPTPG